MTYSPTKFEVATSNGLGRDTFSINVTDGRKHGRTDRPRTDFDTKLIYPFFLKKKAGITTKFASIRCNTLLLKDYEGCSNMNASSFITFFTYMLPQNGKRFYKGLYVTFKLTPNQNKNTTNLSSYSSLNEGHGSILTNSMLRTYTSDIDERIILR